ncbi:hypothetical protein HU200_027464 [Digitaria exilis]|uniref:Major facilitator superfamily (MFS) profile domain-containing protein n=1 Tax=Digitaria exilis TaxID=1010633 RepID=A0A835BY07_9POAL|nr:hypothetical protein HU200_027464 [Digitaria exilis]
MAGGLITTNDNVHDYGEGMTFSVMVTCLMAASCGLILGYDSGISGGVTQMESFLITNYFADRIPIWGWRVSLGLAVVPSVFIVVGAFFISDTPSSLVLRGYPDRARATLQHIRGPDADVDAEFKDIVLAVDEAHPNEKGAFQRLFSKQYRQYLVIGLAIPVFYELTGMVAIAIFSPLLFRTVGFSSQNAILGSVLNSAINLVATLLSSFLMDCTGRKFLFIIGGFGMMICEVAISWIMADHLGKQEGVIMPQNYATGVLVLILMCTFCFGLSWAPLRYVVPSEIYPVEVRSAGQAMSISIALCISFLELQVFIALLCAMKYIVFLLYAFFLLAMTIFVVMFLPETKGVPLEAMRSVWVQHWFWRRFNMNVKQESQAFLDK